MPEQIDDNDPKHAQAAAEILRRHNSGEAEANITTAVRDFLIVTGLVKADEMMEENPPAQGSRRAVDLTALDTFIEFKRRLGTTGGFDPNPEFVQQIDDYLRQSYRQGRVRMGVLTDGKYWLLRWPNAGPARIVPPYAFTLEDSDGWYALYEWLRDHALNAKDSILPSRDTITERFGPYNPSYQRDIEHLNALYRQSADSGTIQVKRQLWQDLLMAALGEIAKDDAELDDLFVRHTYLSAVIGMVVQASFGTDIYQLAEANPKTLCTAASFAARPGCRALWSLTSLRGPQSLKAGLPLSRPWPAALPGSIGRRPPQTLPPSCTRPSFRRRSAASLESTTPRTGWPAQ